MFGKHKAEKKKESPAPPEGVAEIIFCVFDEQRRLKQHFAARQEQQPTGDQFKLLSDPRKAFDGGVLAEAVSSRKPASVSFSYGEGRSKYLHVLPFERKRGKWRFACMQVSVEQLNPDRARPACVNALSESRVCFLLADSEHSIRTVSSVVPDEFGYSNDTLKGMTLSDLFGAADIKMIASCSPDTNESILSCVFHCLDGSKRDVEVKKYSATDGCMLYGIFDVTRQQINEEITAITTRERRRIGQDLHDSIGQLLTGISLLSRSLANGLKRDGNSGSEDAAQISELADDASNQIRQISRGLMPSDIVHRGLYPSLNSLAQVTTDSCGFFCKTSIDETIEFPDGAVETHLFRIAQESVNNAVRHSGGDRIDIVISDMNGMPQLEIRDNGRWRNIMENTGGIGMKTMQYRASAINGQLNIDQVPEGGTRVICRLEAEELLETKVM